MPGKFEVYKDKGGEYRFRLKAANGQNILSSEGYKTKASCISFRRSMCLGSFGLREGGFGGSF